MIAVKSTYFGRWLKGTRRGIFLAKSIEIAMTADTCGVRGTRESEIPSLMVVVTGRTITRLGVVLPVCGRVMRRVVLGIATRPRMARIAAEGTPALSAIHESAAGVPWLAEWNVADIAAMRPGAVRLDQGTVRHVGVSFFLVHGT